MALPIGPASSQVRRGCQRCPHLWPRIPRSSGGRGPLFVALPRRKWFEATTSHLDCTDGLVRRASASRKGTRPTYYPEQRSVPRYSSPRSKSLTDLNTLGRFTRACVSGDTDGPEAQIRLPDAPMTLYRIERTHNRSARPSRTNTQMQTLPLPPESGH